MSWTGDGGRETGVAASAAALIVLFVGVMLINPLPIGVVHDDAMYVILGKSLATGQGLRWINLPGMPVATHYPPGFPALLALVWRAFPDFPANAFAFKALNAVLLALAAAALVVFARRRLEWSGRVAAAVAIVGCLSVPTLVLSTTVMSETFFLALLVPALLYAERVIGDGDTPIVHALALGAIAGALMLVRTHAFAFAGAALVALLLRRRLRAALVCGATAMVVVLPWELWVGAHKGGVPEPMRGDYESYGNWLVAGARGDGLGLAFRTVLATTRELFGMIVGLTTAGIPTIGLRLLTAIAAIAFLVAGVARLSARARVTALFLLAYLGVVVLWPFSPTRFVWGIWPVLVVVFVAGVFFVRDHAQAARWAPIVASAVVATGYGVYTARGYRGQWWSSIGRQMAAVSVPSVAWVGEHTRPTDVVASNAELMVYLYTGRQAVPATRFSVDDYFRLPSIQSRADALESILRVYHADVVAIVANDSLEAAARGMASRQPPALSLRDSVPHGLILSSMVR